MKSLIVPIAIALSALALPACGRNSNERSEPDANLAGRDNAAMAENAAASAAPALAPLIQLIDTTGSGVGSIEPSESAKEVTLKLTINRLPAGTHAIHLHEVGRCDPEVGFATAGAHWNPAGRKHGRDNPAGSHLGDLANIEVSGSGNTTTTVVLAGIRYGAGDHKLADADGTSIVIHAKPDDYKTDPSGDSGDRVACAVLAPPARMAHPAQ